MFSGINEAWNNDPVKDITKRLSNGSFSRPSDMADALTVKKNRNNINDGRINNNQQKESYQNITLSDDDEITDASISLYSTCDTDTYTPFASVDIGKSGRKLLKKNSSCNFNHRHLKKCSECRTQLKRMINSNIEKRMKDILLEIKLKDLHMQTNKNSADNDKPHYFFNDNWKEVAILVMGSIIALLIVYLIVRSINK